MNSTGKSIIASAVVIALCLCAVGGVTYSWFSDTEQADIDFSTAKIDINGVFNADTDVTKVTSGSTGTGVTDTTVSVTNNGKGLSVQNLMSNRVISTQYTVTNNSSVPTLFRMYMTLDGIDDDLTVAAVTITVTGGTSPANVTNTKLSFTDGVSYILGSGNAGVELPAATAGSDTYTYDITIETDSSSSGLPNFSARIVTEAYQSDYTYTPIVLMSSGSASISGTDALTVSGTAPAAAGTSYAQPSDVTVEFSEQAMTAITSSGSSDVGFQATMLEPEGNVARIQLTLNNASTTNFGADGWVTVSVNLPGEHEGITVVYEGSTDSQPQLMGVVYDQATDITTVTFKTNHFSTYAIKSIWYYVDNMEQLQDVSVQYKVEEVPATEEDADHWGWSDEADDFILMKDVCVPNPNYQPYIRLSDSWDNEANKMTSGYSYTGRWSVNGKVTIDLNGKTIINEGTSSTKVIYETKFGFENDVTFLNGTFEIRGSTEAVRIDNYSTVSFDNVTFDSVNTFTEVVQTYHNVEGSHATYIFDGCTIKNGYLNFDAGSYYDDNDNRVIFTFDAIIRGCTFESKASDVKYGALIDTSSYATGSIDISDTKMTLTGTTTRSTLSLIYIDALYAVDYGNDDPVELTLTNVTATMGDSDTKLKPVDNRKVNSSNVTATGCTFTNAGTQVDEFGNEITA